MAVHLENGHAIGYREAGAHGAPLVLFAHCSLGHSGLWKGVLAELEHDFHCIAADLPGHGQSDRGDETISLQDQAAHDLGALAAHFGDGTAHIVGLSIGGAIAGRAAVRLPGLARSLTMIEPIYMQLLTDRDPAEAEENHRVMAPCYAACKAGRYREGAKAFMEGWGQPGQFDKFPEAAKEAVATAMKWIAKDFPLAHAWVDGQISRADLAGVRVPTLLMQGETTQASAKAVVAEVRALIPHAGFAEIAGRGHLSPVEDPEAVAAALRPFLKAASLDASSVRLAACR